MTSKSKVMSIVIWGTFLILLIFKVPIVWFVMLSSMGIILFSKKSSMARFGCNICLLEILSVLLVAITGLYKTSDIIWNELTSSVLLDLILLVILICKFIVAKIDENSGGLKTTHAVIFVLIVAVTAVCAYALFSTGTSKKTDSQKVVDLDSLKDNDRIVIRSSYDTSQALSTIVGCNPVFDTLNYNLYQTFKVRKVGDNQYLLQAANGRYLCAWWHIAFAGNRVDTDMYSDKSTLLWSFYDIQGMGQVIELSGEQLYICIPDKYQDSKQYGDDYGKAYGKTVAYLSEWSGDLRHFVVIEKAPDVFNRLGVLVRMTNKQGWLYAFVIFGSVIVLIWTVEKIWTKKFC